MMDLDIVPYDEDVFWDYIRGFDIMEDEENVDNRCRLYV